MKKKKKEKNACMSCNASSLFMSHAKNIEISPSNWIRIMFYSKTKIENQNQNQRKKNN